MACNGVGIQNRESDEEFHGLIIILKKYTVYLGAGNTIAIYLL